MTTRFHNDHLFGAYSIGLAVGFFGYLLVAIGMEGRRAVAAWMDTKGGTSREHGRGGWMGDGG